jgi:RNA polymerase sigma-70 factor (ECF subfamily)
MSPGTDLVMATPAVVGPDPPGRAVESFERAPDRPRTVDETGLVHRDRLSRLARRLCRNRMDAEDLVQETLLRAFRRFDRFTPGTNGPAWLATILRNIFVNQVRRQGRTVLLEDDAALDRVLARRERHEPATLTPEAAFFARVIDDQRLGDALDRLPGPFRDVLLLAAVDGLSHREIAQRCELPIGTVMSRAFRARRLVRRALTAGPVVGRPDRGRGGTRLVRANRHPRARECTEVSHG